MSIILHLTFHLLSVLFLLSTAVGLTSAHLGGSKGGIGLGIYRLDQAQPESRQATSTYLFLLSPYLPYPLSTGLFSINYFYSASLPFPKQTFENCENFKTPPLLGHFYPKPKQNLSLEKFPTLWDPTPLRSQIPGGNPPAQNFGPICCHCATLL